MRYSVLKFLIILSEAWKKFGDRELTVKIMLPRATFLVSKGD